jgi:catechol 2,3-dioxygenase
MTGAQQIRVGIFDWLAMGRMSLTDKYEQRLKMAAPPRGNREEIPMSVPQEIGHIVLNVTDVERSTKFYRDVVGFQLSRYRPDGTGAFLTCGIVHHNLALFKAPEGAQLPQQGQIGLNHFAFKVQNYQALQEAHKRLVKAGATIDRIVDHGTTRSVYFLDPDGLRMELFSDSFATNEEGLAFIKASPGSVTPLDITAPEPARPAMPQAEYTKVG